MASRKQGPKSPGGGRKKPAARSKPASTRKKPAATRRKPAKPRKTSPRRPPAKKKGGGAKSSGRRWGVMLALLAGVVMVWAAVWLVWSPQGSQRPKSSAKTTVRPPAAPVAQQSPPQFEAHPSSFQRRLTLLDAALDLGLKGAGVPMEAVSFTRARNVVHHGIHFELVETEVELAGLKAADIEENLLEALGRIGPQGATLTGGEVNRTKLAKVFLDGQLVRVIRFNGRKPAIRGRPLVAIIIDDLGYHPGYDHKVIDLKLNLTAAILPYGPAAASLAVAARKKGLEVMLHLPMEPHGYPKVNPGPGALKVGMSARKIKNLVDQALARVPGAKGVNNHMGSRLTERTPEMRAVMAELKARGLFFIDSKTSAKSVAETQARLAGVPAGQRTIFLDNVPQEAAVEAQLQRLMVRAEARGRAIAIGHPYPATLAALAKMAGSLKSRLRLVPASELVH